MLKRRLKSSAKTAIKPILRRLHHWLRELDEEAVPPPEVPFDNNYPWLRRAFFELMGDRLCARRSVYVWGVIQGAALGKILGIPRLSVIECGVAGGAGLISLEHTAQLVASKLGVGIDVYGFDTGTGLPKPKDYRDQPNLWLEGQFPMNRKVLEQRLQKASLRYGLVQETTQQFLAERRAPIAFISFDLDLYSSTKDAMTLLFAEHERLLPRVICYFDDVIGYSSYNDFTGERLAIKEFNEAHDMRKLSPVYGLRSQLPKPFNRALSWDCFYFAHVFDHPLYNKADSIRKPVCIDDNNSVHWLPVDEWTR